MSRYSYKNYTPKVAENVYIASGCKLIGRCILEEGANIWFNSVLRGDVNSIHIGKNTNIQDLSMLHVTENLPLIVGENVTVGHSVTLHACTIGANALIGMGATVLDGAQIGDYCIVGAGSLVPPHKSYPAKSMIMGSPAKVVRQLRDEEIEMLNNHYKSYLKYAQEYETQVKHIDT